MQFKQTVEEATEKAVEVSEDEVEATVEIKQKMNSAVKRKRSSPKVKSAGNQTTVAMETEVHEGEEIEGEGDDDVIAPLVKRKPRQKYRTYPQSALKDALRSVREDKISVLKASKMFGVPENTLRDRVLGKVDPENVTIGSSPLFDQPEEAKIVKHFKTMADIGYCFTQKEIVDVVSQYAVQLGKRTKDQNLSAKWMFGFISRWPEMREIKARSFNFVSVDMPNKSVVMSFFDNLDKCLRKHDLLDEPHLIYNVDEKCMSIGHKPPYTLTRVEDPAQIDGPGKGNFVTIIGAGSAVGAFVPPYLVFPGKRFVADNYLNGAYPSTSGTVSDNGLADNEAFHKYLTEHFIRFVPGRGKSVFLLLDCHRCHTALILHDWAVENNIVMFVLPAGTSRLLHPIDVACYGPFQQNFYAQCCKNIPQKYSTFTKHNICSMACTVYSKTFSSKNLLSGFSKTGVYPLDRNAIPKHCMLIPPNVNEPENISCIQHNESPVENNNAYDDELETCSHTRKGLDSSKIGKTCKKIKQTLGRGNINAAATRGNVINTEAKWKNIMHEVGWRDNLMNNNIMNLHETCPGAKEEIIMQVEAVTGMYDEAANGVMNDVAKSDVMNNEAESDNVMNDVPERDNVMNNVPERDNVMNNVPEIGNVMNNVAVSDNIMNNEAARDNVMNTWNNAALSDNVIIAAKQHTNSLNKAVKMPKLLRKKTASESEVIDKSQKPTNSGSFLSISPINTVVISTDTGESEDDSETCCVCGLFQPKEVANCTSLIFVKWAKCDGIKNGQPCNHWTHLKYCSPVKVLRRNDKFFCCHC